MLWLFSDPVRLPDPTGLLAGLPAGSGVIFRPYGQPDAEAVGRRLRRLTRQLGLLLVVAGDARLARRLGADGLHLPEHALHGHALHGRRGDIPVVTAAAHGVAAISKAARAGAAGVFISPVFETASHPGAAALGPVRFALLLQAARRRGLRVYALGGIDAACWRRLVPLKPDGSGGIGRFI
ncbi:thiamine phosphate synthase [Ferrovibrio sp.]|uniref:thiamine phosphate synthase n=1 Tax=Ferrovibrio sp. TaxID=1917215 RepID=UPI003D0DD82D